MTGGFGDVATLTGEVLAWHYIYLTVSQTHGERTDGLSVSVGTGQGERLVVTSTPPQSVWLVAGLVILDPPARTLSTTRLSDTLTYSATVLASIVLVVICPCNGAVSGLRIVAVILWAGEFPLVVARLSFLDKFLSTFPHEIRVGNFNGAGSVC